MSPGSCAASITRERSGIRRILHFQSYQTLNRVSPALLHDGFIGVINQASHH